MHAPKNYHWKTGYDIAHRAYDLVRLHQTVLSTGEILAGRFVAIRLSDGGSDGVIYDSRADAIRGQRHDASRHLYFQIPLEWPTPQVMDLVMWYCRQAYDNGHREDPAYQLILPTKLEDFNV